MTDAEWRRRCEYRIYLEVVNAGKGIRIRDLKRATHYNRGPEDGIGIWYDALEHLEASGKIKLERDRYDTPARASIRRKRRGAHK